MPLYPPSGGPISELLKAVEDGEGNLFNSLYDRKTLPEILSEKPEMVGISILNYQQIIPGLSLAKKLKDAGVWVVVGGTVYTKFVESLSRSPDFFTMCNAVVVYEGESSLNALAKAIENNKTAPDLSKVPNFIWFNGKAVRVNRPFYVEDISRLPTSDFSGFPLDQYLAPETVLPYNMAKGCYWNRCLFCEIPLIHNLPGSHCRIKPAQLIVDQLEELSERFNTPYFQFTDESCSPALLEEMADIIKQYGEFFLGGDSFTCPEGMDKRTLHQFISETRKELYQLTDMASKHSGWEEYSLLKICNYENKGAISGRKWG